MDREIVTLKRRLSRKWEQKMQYEHLNRLRQVSKQTDQSPPPTFYHMEVNHKKQQIKNQRLNEINKHNSLLITKMLDILQNKETFQQRNLNGFQSISPTGQFFGSKIPQRKVGQSIQNKQSLNIEKRLREHEAIEKQNRKILERLQKQHSQFDVLKWNQQEKQRQKLLNNLKEYKFDEERRHLANMEMFSNSSRITKRLRSYSDGFHSQRSVRQQRSMSETSSKKNLKKPIETHKTQKQFQPYFNMAKTSNVFPITQKTFMNTINDANQSKMQESNSEQHFLDLTNEEQNNSLPGGKIGRNQLQEKVALQEDSKRSKTVDGSRRKQNLLMNDVRLRTNGEKFIPVPQTFHAASYNKFSNTKQNILQEQAYKNSQKSQTRYNLPPIRIKKASEKIKLSSEKNQRLSLSKRDDKTTIISTTLNSRTFENISKKNKKNTTRQQSEVELFQIQIGMKERDINTRKDLEYPRTILNERGQETQEHPPIYDVRLLYRQNKRKDPVFKIFAGRIGKWEEQYEIEIEGKDRVKSVMNQFQNEYLQIVQNLRVMGDSLVLLNPAKTRQQSLQNVSYTPDPVGSYRQSRDDQV